MNLKTNLYVGLGMLSGVICLNQYQTDKGFDKLSAKMDTVDSTLKSWDKVMKPMAAQADSAKFAVMQHKMDSVKAVLANLEKEAVKVAKTIK